MKFLKPSSYLLIFFILVAILLTSCGYRYVHYDLKLSPEVEEMFLLQMTFEDHTDENELVYYPSREFMLQNFMVGLIEEFNSNQYGVRISTWNDLEQQKEFLASKTSNTKISLPLVYKIGEQALVLGQKPRWWKIKKYRKMFQKDHYLSLELNMWAWKQEVRGWFKVRNKKGNVVWREQLKHQSPYIHNDPNSPYLPQYYRLKKPPIDRNSNHYLEMEKTFYELGRTVGISLKETLERIRNLKTQ